jgi:hypothetical protein
MSFAGTAIWHALLSSPKEDISDSFYFAVVTFLTIGYGDIHPASNAAKLFFIVYVMLSLVVQFTVLSCFLSNSIKPRKAPDNAEAAQHRRVCRLPLS